jgi:predicted nucleotidyltransferase
MKTDKPQILQRIKSAIESKNPNAEIILFGSRARGEAKKHSDWDVLILLDTEQVDRKTEKEYREEIFNLELETGEAISTLVLSKKEWESHLSPLNENIHKDGIRL